MHPYQHQQHHGSQNGPSTSQQLLGSVESAASRFKRAFGRKRLGRFGEQDGTESDSQDGRKKTPSPRISTFMTRREQPNLPQYAASTYPQTQRVYEKPSSPLASTQVDQEGRQVSSFRADKRSDSSEVKPSAPVPIPTPINTNVEPRTSQQFVPSPSAFAAIDYILDPPSRISVSSAPSKPGTSPESHTSHPASPPKASPRRSIGHERSSSSSPANTVKRRSMSLSMIPNFSALTTSSANSAAPPSSFAKFTTSPYAPPHQRSQSALPHSGFVSPSLSDTRLPPQDVTGGVTPSDSESTNPSQSRAKLALWTSSNSNLRSGRGSSPSHSKTSSVVATLDSAASAATGFAAQISRRAYEKVNSMLGPSSRPSSANSSAPRHGYESDAHIQRLKTRPSANGPLGSQTDVETSRRRAGSPSGDPPAGPKLGPMLRPPFRKVTQGGGLVFGRPLADCVRDTKPLVVLGDTAGVGIEARFIPALVLRCVQHLERWGITEEGLFRISGRSSHINKLRLEFANGADYDLASCPPSDLDPHSVASVLKAYLRELPEPILTRNMAPLFDAYFENAKQADFMNTGSPNFPASNGFSIGGNVGLPAGPRMGLPLGPRDGMPFPRSVNNDTTTQSVAGDKAEPTSTPGVTPQQAMTTLLEEFRNLVSALPRENRDLLLTINELLAKTAEHSRSNKMPLSNLLLVFCPSMGMNPGVLKVLVENHSFIFNESNAGASRASYSTLPSPPSTAKTSQFDRTTITSDNHPEANDTKHEEPAAGRPMVQNETSAQNRSEPVVIHPPVRKQSLRKIPVDNTRTQITPGSSPSAYKESFSSSGSDSTKGISGPQAGTESPNRTNRTRTSPRPTSPLSSGEAMRPAGPRPLKHTPPPLALRDQSSTPPASSPRLIDHHNRKPSSSSLLGGSGPGSAIASPVPLEIKRHHAESLAEAIKDAIESETPAQNGSSVALTASNQTSDAVTTTSHEISSSSASTSDEVVEINVQELPEVHPAPPMTSSFVQPREPTTPLVSMEVPPLPAIIYYPPSTIDDHSNDAIKVKTKQWAKHAKNSSSTSTVQAPEQLNISSSSTQIPLPVAVITLHSDPAANAETNEVTIAEPKPQPSSNLLGSLNTSSVPLTPLLLAMEKENPQGYDSRQQSSEDLTRIRPEVKPLSLTKKWSSASSGTQDQTDSAFYASSAASSATTDTPQLLERLTSWPEVPKTVPSVYPELPPLEPVSTTNVPNVLAESGRAIPRDNATSTLSSPHDRDTMSTIQPSRNGSQDALAGPQFRQNTSLRPSSMSSDSILSETIDSHSNSNNTVRPVRAAAPRLTVNSKEMISGDSFWAMELQRVLQSASPTSQMESRLSGDWAAVHATGDS